MIVKAGEADRTEFRCAFFAAICLTLLFWIWYDGPVMCWQHRFDKRGSNMTIKMIAVDMDGTFLRDDDQYDVQRFN